MSQHSTTMIHDCEKLQNMNVFVTTSDSLQSSSGVSSSTGSLHVLTVNTSAGNQGGGSIQEDSLDDSPNCSKYFDCQFKIAKAKSKGSRQVSRILLKFEIKDLTFDKIATKNVMRLLFTCKR